jgi:YVTN family beta-propeller protein
VIRTATKPVVKTVTVGGLPIGVAVTPDGTTVYVANNNDNTVSVFRRPDNMVVKTIPVGPFPFGVAIGP